MKFTSTSQSGGGGGSSVRSSSSPARDNPALVRGNGGGSSSNSNSTPQSLPRGHGHLGSVSAVSPAHTHHSARPSAPSPSALKLAAVASSLDRVPKVTPASAVDSIGR